MNKHYLHIIEYDKIIEQLKEHTAFSASRELADRLEPLTDSEIVKQRLAVTTEAKELFSTHTDVTVGGARDVRPLLQRASLQAMLQPEELLDVRNTLLSARKLHYTLVRMADDYPLLAGRAQLMQPLSHIIDEIGRCLDEDGRVLDSASPELARIRRESATARERLMDRLRSMVNNSQNAPYLQEAIITERNGRYVIPLKAQFKGRIPGIIHDQSASGATLFIEPLATVDLNNEWHELQLAERREVERILMSLSNMVGNDADAIRDNVQGLAELDLAFAKAHYSYALHATPAAITESNWPVAELDAELDPWEHPLHLIRARHPLLPSDTVVPIDVYTGGSYTTMVITGPNTGGKTVALKTVGLLAAMNQAGLHIPAADGSRLPVFSGIYADIGDEQSIEQSLSTFSSHMSHIIDILGHADERSLVLLDELGAGTDPVEGAALAQALIQTLMRSQSLTLCSSHYSKLKVFAFNTPGVQNASVEFDVETLSPTFRLVIGLPGRSNAFAIARRLGLPETIIDSAQEMVSPGDLQTDAMLQRIKEAQDEAEAALADATERQEQAQELERELRLNLANIEEARRQVLEEARQEGREELQRVRDEIRRLKQDLAARREPSQVMQDAEKEIEALEDELEPLPPVAEPVVEESTEPVEVGDTVRITTLDQTGELIGINDGEAEVRVGGFRLRTPVSSLAFESRHKPEKKTQRSKVRVPNVASPGVELDLRGYRADEALTATKRYLDQAYLAGLPWVQIIHGKGTGALKSVVRDLLSGHRLVKSYRPGELTEGGDGVTVAELEPLPQSE